MARNKSAEDTRTQRQKAGASDDEGAFEYALSHVATASMRKPKKTAQAQLAIPKTGADRQGRLCTPKLRMIADHGYCIPPTVLTKPHEPHVGLIPAPLAWVTIVDFE
jgi:hypothetical protein